ncbi:MAG: phage/plasmid primase, P4 family [Chloroflexi bacterium]|nr:phage/plasmid primase, P4 family [Chloroflexota bacterium]
MDDPVVTAEFLKITSQQPKNGMQQSGEPYHYTELGGSLRFADMHAGRARYCHAWGKWLIWDGKRWAADDREEVFKLMGEMVRVMYRQAADIEDQKARGELIDFARSCENHHRQQNILAGARPYMAISAGELDADPWLFNVQNGIVDLKTGSLLPHDPERLITKIAPVTYDPGATCPRWEAAINLYTGENPELAVYLQKALGYSLTGINDEQSIFFPYGLGANGKTTTVETISNLAGDYGLRTDIEALLVSGARGQGATPTIAALAGVRFAVASEVPEGRRLNESLIKDLTGGDTLTARRLFSEPFSFKPTHKLWMVGNFRPRVNDSSLGFWRRMRLIPFTVTIPENQRRPTGELAAEFQEEAPGILNWLICGCLFWQSDGLKMPDMVQQATKEYQSESDLVQQFLDERCEFHFDYSEEKAALFKAWQSWSEEAGEQWANRQGQRWLTTQLLRRGYDLCGDGRSKLRGLQLKGSHLL